MDAVGPTLLGCVVGWIIYYFLRRYTVFSPQALVTTIGAIAGGPLLKSIGALDGHMQSFYFAGIGIGFFSYAAYLGILLTLLGIGRIEAGDFELFAGCGGTNREVAEFAKLMTAQRDRARGKITEAAFQKAVKLSQLNISDYREIARLQLEIAGDEGKELIKKFERAGLPSKLKGPPRRRPARKSPESLDKDV